ncbi:hypothetical protein QYE76_000856 [Lolium multiflorum]|uniref:RNase H type-1 domain-containing protein n=1 Tax=Lolium multiflorum TaxID=4521 RepID=A0AAD8RID4_LOLMU|nr:hypothetical protein QYE76_000856 [Lolium multiflorum]
MADDDRCQLCGAQDSWRHALLDCSMARAVWALADEDVTEHLLCSGEEKARDWLSAYAHQPRREIPGDGGRAPRWIPPPEGVMKINVDAAVSKNMGLGAVAAVARNAEGVFCGASAVVLPGKTDAETLEALACREALSLAQDINARRIRVASDCLNVVRSTNQGTMGVYAHVVREFKETARELDERFVRGWTTEYNEELVMEMAVKTLEGSARSAGRRRRGRRAAAGDSFPAAGIMGERRPLAFFFLELVLV